MIRVEFIRQVRRARTWGMYAALAAVPLIVALANYFDRRRGGQDLERRFFDYITGNAVNFAAFTLLVLSNLFLVVVVSAFAGESVAGEASWGTLRYLLIRPVKRVKLIAAKLLVAAVLSAAATFVIVSTSVVIGGLFFGWDDVLVFRGRGGPAEIELLDGLGRLATASGYVSVILLPVVAMGIFLSTLTDSTAAAVVGTIVLVAVSGALIQVPTLEGIRPILPTRYWAEWNPLFLNTRNDPEMWKGVVSALVYTPLFSLLAILRFQRKDILS